MTPTPSPSEIVNLLLIVMMVPVTLYAVSRFRRKPQTFFVAAFLIMAFANVLGVTEHLFVSYLQRDVKNILYALSAAAFAVAMIRQNLAVRGGRL
jgi:hypothetical protein